MKVGRRNVIFVGFSERDIEKIEIQDIRFLRKTWKDQDLTHRFPRVLFFDTWEQAKRHQGLLLFIKMDLQNLDFVEFDIKNRKKYKNYTYIYLVSETKIRSFYQVYNITHIIKRSSKIALMDIYHLFYHPGLQNALNYLYQNSLEESTKKCSRIKLENITKLKHYVNGKSEIDIEEASIALGVSSRFIKRYLVDMNQVYHNVGYDLSKKRWYVVK